MDKPFPPTNLRKAEGTRHTRKQKCCFEAALETWISAPQASEKTDNETT